MTASKITQRSIKILCSHYGSLQYEKLQRELQHDLSLTDVVLNQMLSNTQFFTVVQGTGSKPSGSNLTLDSCIIATTSIKLCKGYTNKSCQNYQNCQHLHLCRFFILGMCKYSKGRKTCKNSHNINDFHNMSILSAHGLQKLSEKELRVLLLQNDLALLPEVCLYYNRGSNHGQFGSCTHKETCNKLHICSYFILGSCKFGDGCIRSHSFTDNTTKLLLERLCLDEELIKNLLTIYQNGNHIKSPPSTGDEEKGAACQQASTSSRGNADSEEICLYFLRKNCSYKDKCIRIHWHLPYKWQIYNKTWTNLANMEQIEMAFCDPDNSISFEPSSINFETMMCGSNPVRRLSTASSVTKPPYFIMTTEWLWYKKEKLGTWTEYGCQDDHALPVTSADLENVYLANKDEEMPIVIGEFSDFLSFKEMCQKNVLQGTSNEVRRRPRFITEEDVEKKIQGKSQSAQVEASACEPKNIPENWDKSTLSDMGYQRVALSTFSKEYEEIQSLFQQTMPTGAIQKIDRNQNLGLWEIFQWQKERMKKRDNGKPVDERFLFCSTDPMFVDAICNQNFEWGSCAQVGTLYGNGRYFARDALDSKMDLYSDFTADTRFMFLARVLVGEFTQGRPGYHQPPRKDGRNTNLYDSCVDFPSDPTIFVIFEKCQIYPEYIIEYID
ncbi:protein mono-ADP-ribosyltransferase PARP12 [Callorhinchus milii]|uniref:protein mono-ADP-ribosyltransferase PARP12 n=1 Tax=Callorhinchus milii TaxID=7868 RepID=UPI001C3F6707|nr:protein mono-ADP-ribosyltransferase PARP12 [Callorhinchus milii]